MTTRINRRFLGPPNGRIAREIARRRRPVTYLVALVPYPASYGRTTGAGRYFPDSIVTIGAVPNPSYVFSRWSDGIEDPIRTFQIESNISLSAFFSEPSEEGTVFFNSNH